MLKIGFSACFMHPDPQRRIFKGKTLLYLEESLAHWVAAEDAMVVLIPTLPEQSRLQLKHLVEDLDGLVLQGGDDVAPEAYGETPLKPEWKGDPVRDRYEIALIQEFMRQNKPILGICRGAQILNVACGGSLYQDILTQKAGSKVHRNWDVYDQNFHDIEIARGSLLHRLYGVERGKTNSIHHQGIRDVGKDLHVEARCPDDGLVEAIRHTRAPFVFAFQWHPEFHGKHPGLLDGRPVLREFLKAAQARHV